MNDFPPGDLPKDFLARLDVAGFSVPQLIGLVLHAHGSPLDLERIAEFLAELGVCRTVPSLNKTWHKAPYLRKTSDGKLALVPDQGEYSVWGHVLWDVWSYFQPLKPEPAALPPIDYHAPITLDEARRALAIPLPASISMRRKIALLVEASGGRLAADEALRLLAECGIRLSRNDAVHRIRGTPGLLRQAPDGAFELVPHDDSMAVVRHIVRKKLADLAAQEVREQNLVQWRREREHAERLKTEEIRRAYRDARKCVIRCVFSGTGFAAASALDPDRRAFHDYTDAAAFAARISESDIVLGLDPWADMERIGAAAAPGGRLVDLSPHVKTVSIDTRRGTVAVTPELVMASTLRVRSPLGKGAALRQYVAHGDFSGLFKRLHADLKMLWRLYEYGCLHRKVRADWGFAHAVLPAYWNIGRLPTAAERMHDAAKSGEEMEIVLHAPPVWAEPWSRAYIVCIAAAGDQTCAAITSTGDRITVLYETIYAIRRHAEAADDTMTWPESCGNVC